MKTIRGETHLRFECTAQEIAILDSQRDQKLGLVVQNLDLQLALARSLPSLNYVKYLQIVNMNKLDLDYSSLSDIGIYSFFV